MSVFPIGSKVTITTPGHYENMRGRIKEIFRHVGEENTYEVGIKELGGTSSCFSHSGLKETTSEPESVLKKWTFKKDDLSVYVEAKVKDSTNWYGQPALHYYWTEEWSDEKQRGIESIGILSPDFLIKFVEDKFKNWERIE